MSRSKVRQRTFSGLLLVGSIGISLLIAELVLQYFSAAGFYVLPPGLNQEFNPAPDTMPGVSGPSVFSVNAIGMRGSEWPEEDRFSILAVHAYNKVLRDACETRGVSCVDPANQLPKDTIVFYDDVHLNESGAEKVAAIVAASIVESGMVDANNMDTGVSR